MIVHNDFKQYDDAWWALRCGKPSASVADKLVTSTGKASTQIKDLAATLAGDLYAGKALDPFNPTPAMKRGTELEPMAREYYQFVSKNEVEEVGIVTDDLIRFCASPDGLFDDRKGVLEIKNLTAKKQVQALAYYRKHNKPPSYYAQVQMQLMVCEADYADLLYHHPDLPSLIIRIEPDHDFHLSLKSQLGAVLSERDNLIETLKEYE